ncbi:MAG: hypothetical protein KC413_03265, partial [Anaerolineales bacterium]|nr:hypothetical protein [Anaerolineales bacterium]
MTRKWMWASLFIFVVGTAVTLTILAFTPTPTVTATPAEDQYIVLAWNDLGMHCYNRDFQDLAVLPPFNTLWA